MPASQTTLDADFWNLHQLVYRYAAAVDACDAAGFVDAFDDAGRLRSYHPGAREPFADLVGHEQLAAVPNSMRGMFRATAHLMTNHLVDVDGDMATGSVMCTARHLHATEPSALVVVIRYVDRYLRGTNGWTIADRQIRFLWSERHEVVDSGF